MFDAIPSQFLVIASTLFAVCMGIGMSVMRMRAHKRPINAKRIIIPPFAMSTGALMFIFEPFRLTTAEIVEVVILGALCSLLLIWKTKFEIRDNEIYLQKSKAFVFILFGLLAIRIIVKLILQDSVDIGELAGMFFLLAFSMIICWRIAMLIKYQKVKTTVTP